LQRKQQKTIRKKNWDETSEFGIKWDYSG